MRDQRKGKLARAPQAGVTLIELMVALGIAAVVLSVIMNGALDVLGLK